MEVKTVQRPPLPPKQAVLLAFIDASIKSRGHSPSHAEMAAFMNWNNDTSARDAVQKLIIKGYVRTAGYVGKSIRYVVID